MRADNGRGAPLRWENGGAEAGWTMVMVVVVVVMVVPKT